MQKYINKREQKFADFGYSSNTVSQTTDSVDSERENSDLKFGKMGCIIRRQRRDLRENKNNPVLNTLKGNQHHSCVPVVMTTTNDGSAGWLTLYLII
jgi:hypothetical protein